MVMFRGQVNGLREGMCVGSLTNLEMHLGSYGQAYFSEIHEAFTGAFKSELVRVEICVASEDNYDGMSSPSGYSSNEDDAPYANAEMVKTVRMEVCKMQDEANRCPEGARQTTQCHLVLPYKV